MSRCIRSCAPLSWGCRPGRPRSKSIPSATHQTESRLRPKSSHAHWRKRDIRCRCGSPWVNLVVQRAAFKTLAAPSRSEHSLLRATPARNGCARRAPSTAPHRFPQLLHQPLKSTVHTSLGALQALRPLHRRPASRELRRRRFCR